MEKEQLNAINNKYQAYQPVEISGIYQCCRCGRQITLLESSYLMPCCKDNGVATTYKMVRSISR